MSVLLVHRPRRNFTGILWFINIESYLVGSIQEDSDHFTAQFYAFTFDLLGRHYWDNASDLRLRGLVVYE